MIVYFAMCSQPLGKSLGVDSWVCGLGETGRSGGGSGWAELPFRSALGPLPVSWRWLLGMKNGVR